jgi:hypothetical protein
MVFTDTGRRYSVLVIGVEIEIEQREDWWYLTVCQADLGNGLARRFATPARRFLSRKAAINFGRRLVLQHLREQGRQESGIDLHCNVRTNL